MTGWVRSSFCAGNGECIEVRESPVFPGGGVVDLRRVKAGNFVTGEFSVTRAEWDALVAGIRAGETFGLPERIPL